LPRDLADVLHYFLPELDGEPARPSVPPAADQSRPTIGERRPTFELEPAPDAPAPLPILGVPIGQRDIVRAALTWNLAVEVARLGGCSLVVTPEHDGASSPLWPGTGPGPLGTEVVSCTASDLDELHATAATLAAERAGKTRGGGIVFVRIPPSWLTTDPSRANPIRWLLLLTSSNHRDLDDAWALAQRAIEANPATDVGFTIHGVGSIAEARNAFERLSRIADEQLGSALLSYGLLVDDLHVYRAIAAQRPIGLAHPQAPAARALSDVARLLYEDARSRVLG